MPIATSERVSDVHEPFLDGPPKYAAKRCRRVLGDREMQGIYRRAFPRMALVHGWTCDDRTWESQVRDLSRTYRVITLDLPGHGKSGSPKDGKLSMKLFARAIEAVREKHRAERVVLVDDSMGAMTVMQYARMYPQHTAALVIVDGSVSMPPDAPRDRMLAMARNYGESLSAREAMVQTMFKPNTTPEVRKQVLSMIGAVPPATPLAAMEAFVDPNEGAFWPSPTRTPVPVICDAGG